jgi:hypothetical protein
MKQLLILLLFILFTLKALTQSLPKMQIKGSIHDKETNIGLRDASITCLHTKDSSRVAMTFTDKYGNFIFDSLPQKDFILYINYMGYQPLIYDAKKNSENANIDLGIIQIKRIGLTLAEIEIIETKPPVKIRKDTIEFNANHFKTKSNALVEDLFRLIPGIQVSDDGTIRVNGEIVKSVMINGHILFSNGDPKTISKNLQADLIDKIQLFADADPKNLKGKGADKIINITIKKNKQNLISGELGAAAGTLDKFAAKANLSRFRENQQILLFGNGDNINGLTDARSAGGSGFKKTWNIGASYIDEVSKKITISTSYVMQDKYSLDQKTSLKKSITNDSILFHNQEAINSLDGIDHGIPLQIEYKIDSLQKITLFGQVTISNSRDYFSNTYESNVGNIRLINNGIISNHSKSQSSGIFGGLTYEKKFSKKGRFLSIWINYSRSRSTESKFNESRNSYFLVNGKSESDTINQNINTNTLNRQEFLLVNYTEPITKRGFLTFSFGEDRKSELSDKLTYSYNPINGLYDKYIDTLSNKFKNIPIQHTTKLSWLYQGSNFNYTISLSSLFFNLSNKDISSENALFIRSTSLIPAIDLNFSLGDYRRLQMYYTKEVQIPDLTQLQPIPDISDPLVVKVGNPELKSMSAHNLVLRYNSYNTNTLRTFSVSINGKLMQNQIINDSRIDSLGRKEIQPFNHSGAYTINFDLIGAFPLKKRTNSININTQSILEKSLNYINGIENINNNLSITQTISYNSGSIKLFDYGISGNVNYNKLRYTNASITSTSYLNIGATSSCNLNLPFGLTISTFLSYRYSSGLTEGYNNNIWILNASISQTLFHHKQGLITIQGIDLLKQNKSIARNIQVDYIEDVKTNTLDRFFLIRFSYFLGKAKN